MSALLWSSAVACSARAVRIHLDRVDGLGDFIELEAVAPASSDLADERRLVAQLRDAFGISTDELVAISYADQLENTAPIGRLTRGSSASRRLLVEILPPRGQRRNGCQAPVCPSTG